MSTQDAVAVVHSFLDLMNKGNMAAAEDLLAEDLERFLPGSPKPIGRSGSHKAEALFYAAFPDLQVTIEETIAVGEQVVLRLTARGTHQGTFQGIAPTGCAISLTEIVIARVQGGKITQLRGEADLLGLFHQLDASVTPAPVPAGHSQR